MAGLFRWIKRTAAAAILLSALSPNLHAQNYLWNYSVWGSYTPNGDGSPFSDPLCGGTTANIFYDNNPATITPKFNTALCPDIDPKGIDFGAQFSGFMFTWNPGFYSFYVGSDDGSSLFIDGVNVMDMSGNHGFTSKTVSVFLGALSHTYLLNYYADDIDDLHGKAIQATVDPRLNVTTYDESLLFHGMETPEPSGVTLAATGFAVLAGGLTLRRRKAKATISV